MSSGGNRKSGVRRPANDPDDAPSAPKSCRTTRCAPAAAGSVHPSPYQMRQLWDHDNKCANKYMGVPLRVCKSSEPPDKPGDITLSSELMSLILSDITNMWRRLSSVMEVFIDKENPALGYRLRVKPDLPINISMKESDHIVVGWRANYAPDCSSQHLYARSDLDSGPQFMGGPISYSNWAPNKSANINVRQVSHGSGKHLVRAETKVALKAGTELLWDYGKKNIPDFCNEYWFNPECCSILEQSGKRHLSLKKGKIKRFEDLCVLCGQPYRSKSSPGRRAQKKVHLLNSHADFLGTEWDGCGQFDCQVNPVNYDLALLEAERLNRVMSILHSNGWNIVPACAVMTARERTGDSENIMITFQKHCRRLRKLGCIVLRGRTVPTDVEHLQPVRPSRWDRIFPKTADKPNRSYAMNEADRLAHEDQLQNWTSQDIMMIMNTSFQDGDSSSDDDSSSDND